jgi:hypothetical protein
MTTDVQRHRNTEWARRRRERQLEVARQTAQRCPKKYGPGTCGCLLRAGTDTIGRTIIICDWCDRKKAGMCRHCSRPPYAARAVFCADHARQIRRQQIRASEVRHADERRKRQREAYWANEEKRLADNEYKRLWRKANRDKVREQKRRYVERHRGDPKSAYVRYQQRYRKQFKLHRRDIVKRLNEKLRRPIPNCDNCGKPTGWTPVPGRTGGRPWDTCMKCAWPFERKRRRKIRREAAKRIASDPSFGLPAKPVRVKRPTNSPPRGPGDERMCVTPGCDIVVSHRNKKCSKCKRREAELAAHEIAKTCGRGRRTDLERESAA